MDLIGTMLVGPKEGGLERALQSLAKCNCNTIHALVDTLDMHSTRLLDKYNVKVFEREWTWEFGPSRDYLQTTIHEDTRWQLWIDTDDSISDESAELIKEIVAKSPPATYRMPYVYVGDAEDTTLQIFRVRMFPPWIGGDRVRWHLRAHEYPDIPGGIPIKFRNDIPIVHHWKPNESGRANRYIWALSKDLEERPDDSRVMHYLAQSLRDGGRIDESIDMYRKYLDTGGWDEERMKACIFLSFMYQVNRNDLDNALKYALQSIDEKPGRREPLQRAAEVYSIMGNWSKSHELLTEEVKMPRPDGGQLFVCEDHYGARPWEWMVVPCDKLGKYQEGYDATQEILKYKPGDEQATNNSNVFRGKLSGGTSIPRELNRRQNSSPTVYFHVGLACERWTAESVNRTGIGGRETSNTHMAIEMAKLGWNVVMFPDMAPDYQDGIYGGIMHVDFRKFHDYCRQYPPDVIISSFRTHIVDVDFPARLKILWSHDMGYGNSMEEWPDYLSPERRDKFDKFFFMSQFQMDSIVPAYNIPANKCYLTRSGIKVDRFEGKEPARNRHRFVYSSSADRGLIRLLDYWPDIRRICSDAELHIYYGFLNAIESSRSYSEEQGRQMEEWCNSLKSRMDSLDGVHYHDRIPQDQLAEEYMKSGIWAYPTHFTETMCLSVLEACAAGCVPVTTNLGALTTTLGEYGTLIDGDTASPEYKDKFLAEVGRLLTDDDYWELRSELACRNIYDNFNKLGTNYWDWQAIAEEWDEYLRSELGENSLPYGITGISIEIGSGDNPTQATIHTDIREGLDDIECVNDIRSLPFKNDSVASIQANQVLEHISWRDTQLGLNEAWNTLKPGGTISVAVPEFYLRIAQFISGRKNVYDMCDMIYGLQDYPNNYHKAAFTLPSLRSELARAGFRVGGMELVGDNIRAIGIKPQDITKDDICGVIADRVGIQVEYPDILTSEHWGYHVPMMHQHDVHVNRLVNGAAVSIIILAHKHKDVRTIPCFNAIRSNVRGITYEIIGVDDGSDDGTWEFLKDNADIAVRLSPRRGLCAAQNAGIRASTAPFVCFLEHDVEVKPAMIENMVSVLSSNPQIGLVGTVSDGLPDTQRWMDFAGGRNLVVIPSNNYGGIPHQTITATNQCTMLRRRDLIRCGLYDEFIYNSWSDHDMCRNIWDMGSNIAILFNPLHGYLGGDSLVNEPSAYSNRDIARRFAGLYYFHLKWNYKYDLDTCTYVFPNNEGADGITYEVYCSDEYVDTDEVKGPAYQLFCDDATAVHTVKKGVVLAMQKKWEIMQLIDIIAARSPRYILEIGTYMGGTLALMGKAASPQALLIGIDSHQYDIDISSICSTIVGAERQVHILAQCNSHSQDTINKVKELLGPNMLDVLFIDGDHAYDSAKVDLEMYGPMVRDGGIIAFHDINSVHPYKGGPYASTFWNDIKGKYKHSEFIQDMNQDGCGIGIIFK